MNDLQLVKEAKFGEVTCDFYGKGNEVLMTCEQLGECLGYSDPVRNVNKVVSRNDYLKSNEFSTVVNLTTIDGKQRNTRVFTEDGIYEVTLLAKTEKAKEFRAWVRKILKSLRKGETKIISMTDYQRMMAETRAQNVKIRKASLLNRIADQHNGTFKQVLQAYATKELTGEFLLPLPEVGQRTYSAGEIGGRLGISANMVGRLTNENHLKTDTYGIWCNDKAKTHNKEIPSFRYYDSIVPVLQQLLGQKSA